MTESLGHRTLVFLARLYADEISIKINVIMFIFVEIRFMLFQKKKKILRPGSWDQDTDLIGKSLRNDKTLVIY